MVEDVNEDGADDDDPSPASFRVVMPPEGCHFTCVEREIGQKTSFMFGTSRVERRLFAGSVLKPTSTIRFFLVGSGSVAGILPRVAVDLFVVVIVVVSVQNGSIGIAALQNGTPAALPVRFRIN